jgi:hypothetical protein
MGIERISQLRNDDYRLVPSAKIATHSHFIPVRLLANWDANRFLNAWIALTDASQTSTVGGER